MFKMKQHKFQVQNVLFVILTNAVCIKELFNNVVNSVFFGKTALVEGHVLKKPHAARSVVYRCIRTEVDILRE